MRPILSAILPPPAVADDHGDVTGRGDPAAGLHADLRLHVVGQPGDEAVVTVEVQDHGDRPDDEGLAHTRVCPDLGIGVDLFALSLIALVAVGLGSGERGGVLHAEDHEDDEDDGQRADAEAPAPADAGQRERRHGAADDIAEVPHGGSDAAHEAALIGGHDSPMRMEAM